ncbi:MAG TPA: MFS transporter [Chloroflexia bacterium]|nr:MFS transporter [Chloroflexia bacterium]
MFSNSRRRFWSKTFSGSASTVAEVQPSDAALNDFPTTALLPTDLTAAERVRGQSLMFQEGNFWALMNTFTMVGGTVITAFALYLKADAFAIGLMNALPLLAALLQLWTPQMVARFGSRRQVCVITLGGARLLLIPLTMLALASWWWPAYHDFWLILLLTLLSLFAALTAIGGTCWLSWASMVVPFARRASFFAWRNTTIGAIGLVASLGAGFFLDWWSVPTPTGHEAYPAAYPVLFALAALAGVWTVFLLRRTPDLKDYASAARAEKRPSLYSSFVATWRFSPLRRYMIFRAIWMFALSIALPYYNVYMLENLHLSFTQVFLLQNIGALASLLSMPWWGRMLDRYGCSRVLFWSSWLKVFYILLWALLPASPTQALAMLFLLHATLLVDAGLNLSAGNFLMNLLPSQGNQNVGYFSVFSTVISLTSAVGPLLAGILLSVMDGGQFTLMGLSLGAIPMLFMLSAVLRVISLLFYRGFSDRDAITIEEI